ETFAHWSVFIAAKRSEFLKLTALLWVQARRHFDDQPCKQICLTAPVNVCYPLSAQLKHLARLRACGDFKVRFALQRRHIDFAAQSRNPEWDRHVAVQIVPFAVKDIVLLDVNDHVQIACGSAANASLAISRRT